MLSPREFVEPSLRISSKSVCLNPQSLRDSPLLRGVTLLFPPSPGGLSQDKSCSKSGCSMKFNELNFIELTLI